MTESIHPTSPAAAVPSRGGGDGLQEPGGNAPVARRALRLAWLWFAPPFLVAALYVWLQMRIDDLPTIAPIIDAPYVQTLAGDSDAALRALLWQASQPLLISVLTVAALLLIVWRAVVRWGWARVTPLATGLWCVVWAGLALALVARYANRVYLTPLPPVTASVIAAQPYPSSEHGPGGAVAWLTPPPGAANADDPSAAARPWRVRIEGADFQAMPAGTRVTLQRARGALWGTYLTDSDAPLAPEYEPMPAPVPAPGQPSVHQPPPADPS